MTLAAQKPKRTSTTKRPPNHADPRVVSILASARTRVAEMYTEVANISINRADDDGEEFLSEAVHRLLKAVRNFECDVDELEGCTKAVTA